MTELQLPGVWVECLHSPVKYSLRQLELAIKVAWALRRGRFVLLETPAALRREEP